jgi:hypothetical protein
MDSILLRPTKLYWKTVCPQADRSNSSLALMELRLVIAIFIWNFDVDFVENGQPEPYYKDALVAMRGALPLKITPVQLHEKTMEKS